MNFLFPHFLWGLLALIVPIVVHFFYLRRSRRYEFSRALWVERLKQFNRPYLKLHHWILLFLRLAALSAIVLLFARPQWGKGLSMRLGGTSVLVIVDVSPSMHPVWATLQALLQEVLRQAPASQEFRLLTTDSYVPRSPFLPAALMKEKVAAIQPADMGYPLAYFLERSELFFREASYEKKKIYVFSDFQRTSVGNLARLKGQVKGDLVLFPVRADWRGNAWFDSVNVAAVGDRIRVAYRLQGPKDTIYTIQVGNRVRPCAVGRHEELIPLTEGRIELQIRGDAIEVDNWCGIGWLRAGERQALCGGDPRLLSQSAFQRLFEVLSWPKTDLNTPTEATRLWVGELGHLPGGIAAWVAEGGTLVAFAPAQNTPLAWRNAFFDLEVDGVLAPAPQAVYLTPLTHPLWEEVFVPIGGEGLSLPEPLTVASLYLLRPSGGRVLLQTAEGTPLFWEIPWQKGFVYLFAFPWWGSSLGHHSLFVPLFERLFWRHHGSGWIGYVPLGTRRTFTLPAAEGPVTLRHTRSSFVHTPHTEAQGHTITFSLGEYPLPAGLYGVYLQEKLYGYIGVNRPSSESYSDFLAPAEWEAAGLAVEVRQWSEGAFKPAYLTLRWRPWWLWLGLALGLLMAEIAWSRRLLRPASVSSP
ncbi:MAG: BatA domain-containing protein [Bacteroidia bacterium]|nr:BatA domain-containing protein [Bacteroidia bacterium]MDW8088582.1 BatA domain-containing protein [Bacteroidia bacterium]